jgi:hypothetical protein
LLDLFASRVEARASQPAQLPAGLGHSAAGRVYLTCCDGGHDSWDDPDQIGNVRGSVLIKVVHSIPIRVLYELYIRRGQTWAISQQGRAQSMPPKQEDKNAKKKDEGSPE